MKKLSLILMLSISTMFVGCKKETSTVGTSTTTGGTSSASDWDSVYTFEEISYIQFSDNKKFSVFASNTPFGLKTTITTDGGLSWSSNTSKYHFQANYSTKMVFFDSKNGYASSNGSSNIIKTVDGGLNWTEQNFKNYRYSLINDKSLIVFTTDSVHVFENGSLTSHYRDNRNFDAFFGGDYYSFYTDNAIYLISRSNSNVLKSEDNGKTWQALTFGASFQNEIQVLNSSTWYTLSNYSLYVTKDTGVTWNKVVDNYSYNTLRITNGIIFTYRSVSLSDFKPMYSTDGINYKENKIASKYAGEFFTLNGRVYYTYGKNLYRRKF